MEQIISKELLLSKGFEDITNDLEKEYYKKTYCIDNYMSFRKWTNEIDKNPGKVLKLDIDNGFTNNGAIWHLHIDNCDCCSIGAADINSVEQFNKLMEVFESNFRL